MFDSRCPTIYHLYSISYEGLVEAIELLNQAVAD